MPAPIDLEARLDAMLDALETSKRVIVRERRRRPLSPKSTSLDVVIRDLSRDAGITLQSSLRRCWVPFAEFAVHWESADAERATTQNVIGGEAALSYLYDVASHDTQLATERTDEPERTLLRSLRVIDDQPAGGNGTLAAVRLLERELTSGVWFFDVRTGVHELDVDYCGYLEALITTKGGYGWQYLYADVDLAKPEHRMIRDRLSRLLQFLATTFPDVDCAPLRERFAARTTRTERTRH